MEFANIWVQMPRVPQGQPPGWPLISYKLTLDHAHICVANNTFWWGSFWPLGETKLDIKMEKRLCVTHQFNYSVVNSDRQSQQTRCASIAARLYGAAHTAVGYGTRSIFTERKGLSAFIGKFPLSTAGLHLVLNSICLRKNHV